MITLYRACPFRPTKPLPVKVDKHTLVKMCLESFLKTEPEEIVFLLDSYDDSSIFAPHGRIIDCTGLGNAGTFHKQLEIALEYEFAFLVEDDYMWRPGTFKHMKEAVHHLDFVSPYDHPGHYLEERFDKHYETKLIGNNVYREAPSNTLTFATSKRVLSPNYGKMKSFGTLDHPMFEALRGDGFRMWNPTHSYATHMVEGLLAPNVEWDLKTP